MTFGIDVWRFREQIPTHAYIDDNPAENDDDVAADHYDDVADFKGDDGNLHVEEMLYIRTLPFHKDWSEKNH